VTTPTADQDDFDSTDASDSSPDILPGEPPGYPGDPAGGKMLGPSTPRGVPAQSGPEIAPPALPASSSSPAEDNRRSAALQQRSVGPSPGRVQATAAAPAAVVSTPPAESPAPISPAAPTAPPVPGVSSSSAPAAPPQTVPLEPADPIAEAPEMIWYVRPPSGGQFGPASGDLMRTWLSEGRVSADSLVWREGWRDWQEAGQVFPKLRGNPIMDFLETTPLVAAAPSPSAHVHRVKVKRSSDRNQVALLVILSLLVVVLLFVFLWVLFK